MKMGREHWGCRCSLVVRYLPSMGEALGSIPSTAKETTKRRIVSERPILSWYYCNSADPQSSMVILQSCKTLTIEYRVKGIWDCRFITLL